MSEDVKVEQISGNVFKDVGFSDAEAERALSKADLAVEIYNIIGHRFLPIKGVFPLF